MTETGVEESSNQGSLGQLPSEKVQAIDQIRTVIGHSRAIEGMIEDERYCTEVLKQIAVVQSSLINLSRLLTRDHMRVCISEAISGSSGEEKIDELMETLKYLRNS